MARQIFKTARIDQEEAEKLANILKFKKKTFSEWIRDVIKRAKTK